MKQEKNNIRLDLSENVKTLFTLEGVYLYVKDAPILFLSHAELKSLSKARKRYNHMFKLELEQKRELEDMAFIGDR